MILYLEECPTAVGWKNEKRKGGVGCVWKGKPKYEIFGPRLGETVRGREKDKKMGL